MSIVPYDHNQQIVFHDPQNRILVLHNNQDNSIQLLTSSHSENEYPLALYRPVGHHGAPPPNRCPHCGSLQGEFSNQNASFGRTTDPPQEESYRIGPQHGMPAEYVHDEYFKMLSKLPYGNVLGDMSSEGLPADIFNQGYFDRFFRKIPPYVLGSGAHAQVYKVMHVLKDIQLGVYAVKRINVGDHLVYLDQVLNEVLILYELSVKGANENNLIRYNHVWMELGDLRDLETIFLSDKDGYNSKMGDRVPYVFILQQYCGGGHLENLIIKNFQKEQFMTAKEKVEAERRKRRQRRKSHDHSEGLVNEDNQSQKRWLTDFEVWKLFRDVANGVHYLHSHGILHRDLKPSNCLLESSYDPEMYNIDRFSTEPEIDEAIASMPKVLVSDFGEGKFIDKQFLADQSLRIEEDLNNELRGNTGTIEFTDPRLWTYAKSSLKARRGLKLANSFSYNSDIYSLGMILCFICTGALPFTSFLTDATDPEQIRRDISRWYQTLTPKSFHSWFEEKLLRTLGVTDVGQDFELLIYMSLKGGEGSLEVSSKTVLDYLNSMKWKHFLSPAKNRRVSEVTVKGDEPLDDENVVDLFEDVRQPPPIATPVTNVKINVLAPVLFHLGQILLSEMIDSLHVMLGRALKLMNLGCLAIAALKSENSLYWPAFYTCFVLLLFCDVYFAAIKTDIL